ncbi:g3477 [Coccomyxa elongata]
MKQASIGRFFAKPNGIKASNKDPTNAEANENREALKTVNSLEKKRVREVVPAHVSGPSTALQEGGGGAGTGARLKRLRKVDGSNKATTAAGAQAASAFHELEDEIDEPSGNPEVGATPSVAPDAIEEASPAAGPSPNKSPAATKLTQESEQIEDSDKEGAEAPPHPIAPPVAKGKGKAKGKAVAAKKKPAKASTAEALAAVGNENGDNESASEASSGCKEDGQEGEDAASKPGKMAVLRPPKAGSKPGKAAEKMEGVGLGAVAAAKAYANYDSVELATWKAGEPVPFLFLAHAFEAIANEPKRLQITQLLVTTFRTILATTPEDLLPAVYLCSNQVAPSHEGLELGIGDSILMKALCLATGKSMQKIKDDYAEAGDLGNVAAAARAKQKTMFKPKPLTVQGVFKAFQTIARTQGAKSQDKKIDLINKLLVSSSDVEPGFIMRALQGKLRIGLGDETVRVALAHAQSLHRHGASNTDGKLANRLETAVQAVKQAYSQCPSYDVLIPALLQYPIEELPEHVKFTPGVPVKPMLAKATTGIAEVLDKFADQEFTCEYKYDGERAQVHYTEDGKVFIYSRNSENNTGKYPDIAAVIPSLVKEGVKSMVLDCEAVAFERATGKILPFQVLSTRKRKDVEVADIKVQVCLFAFDCLYLNGTMLLQRPLTERRAALSQAVHEKPGELQYALFKTSTDVEELGTFLNESVAAGTEGLIVKTLDSTYEPSKRSLHWLKLKKDYLEGVGDTLDVAVIGAWFGKGKRSGVYGAFLLAVFNAEGEEFQTISKIGTGFSEEQLKQFSEELKEHIIPTAKPYYRFSETLLPDVWFDAKTVWEVKCADFSISPRHKAALGLADPDKGISIRFPRLVKVRDDKSPEDATSAEQVAEMYFKQALTSKQPTGKADDED